ncbi:Protein of unknown function, partial [Gryllus bimaculatus]
DRLRAAAEDAREVSTVDCSRSGAENCWGAAPNHIASLHCPRCRYRNPSSGDSGKVASALFPGGLRGAARRCGLEAREAFLVAGGNCELCTRTKRGPAARLEPTENLRSKASMKLFISHIQ